MSILFNRCVSLQVDPIFVNLRKINSSPLNGVHFICPKVPLFSCPPTLFLRGLRFLNQASFYSCEVSSFFSSNVLPGGSHEDALLVRHSSLIFLLWWIQLKLSVLIIFLSLFQMLPHSSASINYSPHAIHLFWSAEDISEDFCLHYQSVQVISRL